MAKAYYEKKYNMSLSQAVEARRLGMSYGKYAKTYLGIQSNRNNSTPKFQSSVLSEYGGKWREFKETNVDTTYTWSKFISNKGIRGWKKYEEKNKKTKMTWETYLKREENYEKNIATWNKNRILDTPHGGLNDILDELLSMWEDATGIDLNEYKNYKENKKIIEQLKAEAFALYTQGYRDPNKIWDMLSPAVKPQ